MSRVLLVSPTFHGYWRAIEAAFESRGHAVTTHVYDGHVGPFARTVTKGHELLDRMGRDGAARRSARQTEGALATLRTVTPEVVVVVKGDTLGPSWWEEVERRQIRRVTWLYDELRRTAYAPDVLDRLGPIASYSAQDVATLRAGSGDREVRHLPLAYDHRLLGATAPNPASGTDAEDVVFVGARYPRREQLLEQLVRAGVPVRAFGRDWSRHPVDRLRTWDPRRPAVPAGRDLERVETYRTMQRARAVLNIHGDQDGFTMRTFEACGVGALQLIDRADLGDLYAADEDLATFESSAHLAELIGRARTDRAWADGLRRSGRARTLAQHTFDHRVAVLEEMWA